MKLKQASNTQSGATSKSSSVMAKLLASHKDSFVPLHKGDLIKGKIIKLTPSEILVDIGAKSSAMVLEKEKPLLRTLLSIFKVGDTVEVSVLSPESETGQPVVSLRRFLSGMAWEKLEKYVKSHEAIKVKVSETAKAGYVVTTDFGITGFLPQSHIAFSSNNSISVGSTILVSVLELNRKENKIIFSQKPVISDEEFAKMVSQFKIDEKVKATITNVTTFGLFVTLPVKGDKGVIEGFMHISEIAWDKTEELNQLYNPGQQIEAKIIKVDTGSKKIHLSIKRLTKDPFEEIMERFPVDSKVVGIVSEVDENGLIIEMEDGVSGVIRKEKVPPTEVFKKGQKISALVSEYDKRRKKVLLVPVLLKKTIGYR